MRQAKLTLTHSLLALALLAPAGAALAADAPAPDAKLAAAMEAADLQYDVDEDGDLKLVFELDNKRTQLALVRNKVESYGDQRIREVWAPGYKATTGKSFPADVANRLLVDSMDSKLGGWAMQDGIALFVIRIPADASPAVLRDAIEAAADTADKMEAELTGKDDF
jgi:hypothetical protein